MSQQEINKFVYSTEIWYLRNTKEELRKTVTKLESVVAWFQNHKTNLNSDVCYMPIMSAIDEIEEAIADVEIEIRRMEKKQGDIEQ
jgi:hypothetical protein